MIKLFTDIHSCITCNVLGGTYLYLNKKIEKNKEILKNTLKISPSFLEAQCYLEGGPVTFVSVWWSYSKKKYRKQDKYTMDPG